MIEKKLSISKEKEEDKYKKNKFSFYPKETLTFIRRKGKEHVLFPFSWGLQFFGDQYRTKRQDCICFPSNKGQKRIIIDNHADCSALDASICAFQGSLRPEQEIIQGQCIQYLNQHSSCILAVYPGGGKCLAKGEKVLLANGYTKKVEDLSLDDFLYGDDHEPKHILSLTKGQEALFRVSHAFFPNQKELQYTVNESHILTVIDIRDHIMKDKPINDIIRDGVQYFLGVYYDVDALGFNLQFHRKWIQSFLRRHPHNRFSTREYSFLFSIVLKCGLSISSFSQESFQDNDNNNNGEKKKDENGETYFRIEDPSMVLQNMETRGFQTYPIMIEKISEQGTYFGFELDGNGRFLLSQGICTHNTITSLSIASKIKLRTLIFVNKLVLMEQWKQSILSCYGPKTKYQVIQGGNTIIDQDCHFYIMNALNCDKYDLSSLRVGFVIVDECHLMMTKILSNALFTIQPRYLLGLSATPYRSDGFDVLLELFFGLHRVVRPLHRLHHIFVVNTKIKFHIEKDARGNTIWNSAIQQQCMNIKRNHYIFKLCVEDYKDRNILILTKRIDQMRVIKTLFEKHCMGNEISIFQDSFNKNARVLMATFQKVGTGFSHDKLDMLILGCDTEEYFIQYLGRVFRRPDVVPIIIDIVDQHPIFSRHFQKRKKVYIECGGVLSEKSFSSSSISS
ncbi:MAG: hypothetical protein EBR40_11200 [Proteobacteria bacterium]|nr:hypothetical protein [Pseudomonadota bacterium]